jgi:hypothetical protein
MTKRRLPGREHLNLNEAVMQSQVGRTSRQRNREEKDPEVGRKWGRGVQEGSHRRKGIG